MSRRIIFEESRHCILLPRDFGDAPLLGIIYVHIYEPGAQHIYQFIDVMLFENQSTETFRMYLAPISRDLLHAYDNEPMVLRIAFAHIIRMDDRRG